MRTLTLRRVVLVTALPAALLLAGCGGRDQRGARLCVSPDHPDDSVCDRVVTAQAPTRRSAARRS